MQKNMATDALFAPASGRRPPSTPVNPTIAPAVSTPAVACSSAPYYIAPPCVARRAPDPNKPSTPPATVAPSDPAFGRFPWDRMGLPPAAGAVTGLGIMVLLVIIYDLASLHRIHRSTMWAAPLTFAVGALSVPIGMTSAWHAFAALLNRTIGPHI